ncbi:phosphomannomutase/phosphoglucomutase [Isoalcanivorax indicus]|uniref:phosphomannomutase/phosphoglucomutase n=1 Tax=Isoalcanivorax indicus TaxID=2202653 RepID=UPI001FE344EE|nr:phosphomannomutase/phosphoglucomutase [Isoalcanivorax indicus]
MAKREKKKPEKHNKKASSAAPQTGGMNRFIIATCVVAALAVGALTAFSGWLLYGPAQQQRAVELANTLLQQPVALINQKVAATEAQLEVLARSSAVRQGFDGDPDTAALRLSQQLPDFTITLVPTDERIPRAALSFSARDLVQQARTGQAPGAVLIPGSPLRLVAARGSEDGRGIVLVEQSLEPLVSQLRRMSLPGGGIEIRQQGNNTTLVSIGQPRGETIASATAAAELTLTYRGEPAPLNDSRDLFLIGAGSILLVLLALLVLTLRQIGSHIAADAHRLVSGSSKGFTFSALGDAASSLAQRAASAPAASPRARAPAPEDAFLDILVEEDVGLLIRDSAPAAPSAPQVPEEIFREYDIRGIVGKTLNAEIMELIGRAIGSEAGDAGQQTLLVARDGRTSSEELTQALTRGLLASGRDVIDLGAIPTPILYYGTAVMDVQSGVMVTGSHNPSAYNGVKVVIGGETLSGDRIRGLHQRITEQRLSEGQGRADSRDIRERYLRALSEDIVLARPLKVVIDCGNGITGMIAPQLFRELGCEVMPLFAEVDGHFPNHHPDPSRPENLHALIQAVKQHGADIGIAFDGDGDRLGVITPSGQIIWPDRLLMLYARDLLSRSPGADIIFDVKCSRELAKLISRMGGRPLMWKSGHALMKAKLRETGAALAGEMSGHMFFADRWNGMDDGLYAAARLLEILALESGDADSVFARLKTGMTTPELLIPASEQSKFALIERLVARQADFADGSVSTLDGLRVDFEDGWGLVRASNTTPALTARFEGRDKAALHRIVALFRKTLQDIEPKLKLPF